MLQTWKSPGESQVSVHVERAQGPGSDVSEEWEQQSYNRTERSSARSRGKCCVPYGCFIAPFSKETAAAGRALCWIILSQLDVS